MAETAALGPARADILAQEEKVEKKGKWMYPFLIAALILFFIVIFSYGLGLVTTMEHPYPPVPLSESATPVPQDNAQLADYLNRVVADALAEKPRLTSERRVRIDGDSVRTNGGAYVMRTLDLLKNAAEDALGADFSAADTAFGDPLDGLLPAPALTADDIDGFSVDYVHYYCVVCGAVSDEQTETCAACGSDYRPQMRYADDYSFTVTLKNTPELSARLFGPDAAHSAQFLAARCADYAVLDGFDDTCESLTLHFVTDRLRDELKELSFCKVLAVSANVAFTKNYAGFPPAEIACTLSDTTVYRLTYPCVTLNKHELSVEPNKRDELVAARVQTDPDCAVKWTSSDESVVTVDDEGFLKAGKNPGTATITATMAFNGKTYADSCRVDVKISVKFVRLNKHKLKLKTGESETLKARVASDEKGFAFKKPTVTTVSWHTTDENVARVDENGTVTAVAPGEATVYALTDDGFFKSSCTVTVS